MYSDYNNTNTQDDLKVLLMVVSSRDTQIIYVTVVQRQRQRGRGRRKEELRG